MPALIPEAFRSLKAAVVLHWKSVAAKGDSKPCKAVPVLNIYIAAGPRERQKILWGPVVHHMLGDSVAGDDSWLLWVKKDKNEGEQNSQEEFCVICGTSFPAKEKNSHIQDFSSLTLVF